MCKNGNKRVIYDKLNFIFASQSNFKEMKKVSILVPESSVMQAIVDPQYLFSAVNQFLAVSGRKPLFDVQLVGLKKEVKLNDGLFSVNTSQLLKDVKKTDLVIILHCLVI